VAESRYQVLISDLLSIRDLSAQLTGDPTLTDRMRATSEIARTLHCNPDYLGRVYRETFGHSLTNGIHQARMHHAKNLLLLSSLNVKEISAACGYGNPDYFRRMFRRFFDMQPNQFRSLHPRQHTNAA